jgi:hypothetical protein
MEILHLEIFPFYKLIYFPHTYYHKQSQIKFKNTKRRTKEIEKEKTKKPKEARIALSLIFNYIFF